MTGGWIRRYVFNSICHLADSEWESNAGYFGDRTVYMCRLHGIYDEVPESFFEKRNQGI